MSAADAHVGDLGVTLAFTARIAGDAVDLTGATLDALYVQSPSGVRSQWTTGLAITGAAAGLYRRITAADASELTEPGEWTVQLQTTEGAEVRLYDTETFIAGESLVNAGVSLRAANPAMWGYLSRSVAGNENVTLVDTEYSLFVLHLTGALTGNIAVIVPTLAGAVWLVSNATSGAFTLTVRTAAGTGPTVTQGQRRLVYCDGTNIVTGAAETT